jgi:N-acetyl-anhydromuramyl-L-alanine amidase AmpD
MDQRADQPDANLANADQDRGDQTDVDQAPEGDELMEFFYPQNEFSFGSEFENWQGEVNQSDPRIIDLTARADKSRRLLTRDPKKVWALVLHQMACCFKVKDPLTRFLKMAPHFAILPDGRILQLHPILSLTGASNGFNAGSVAVEFAGNFPDTRGRWWHGEENGRDRVTPAQIEAGRYLVRYLIRTMGLREILAHRQSSGTRDNDPGPDIWYQVGQWAIDNLGLKDGGPGFKVGTGNAIPDVWRRWGSIGAQHELTQPGEVFETEFVEAAGLGLAAFDAGRNIASGDLSVQSDLAKYVHPNTPAHVSFTRRTVDFKISAHNLVLTSSIPGITPPTIKDVQEGFYFRISFEYNGYDLRNVVITRLDKSSSLYLSSFDINFRATEYSQPSDPVASIAFNIVNGRWDPFGPGDYTFSATPFLVIKANGQITPAAIDSDKGLVRFDGFINDTLRDIPVGGPTTPGLTPQPTSASASILRTGSRGPAVTDLQIRLNRWLVSQGRAPLTVDADFGARTRAAVMAFQQAVRLPQVDGIVGAQTMRMLRNY